MLTLKLIRLTKRYYLKRIGIFFSLQYKSKPSPLLWFTLKSPISNENTVQIQIIKALQESDNRQFLNSRNTDYFSERKAEPGTIPINPRSQPLPFHPILYRATMSIYWSTSLRTAALTNFSLLSKPRRSTIQSILSASSGESMTSTRSTSTISRLRPYLNATLMLDNNKTYKPWRNKNKKQKSVTMLRNIGTREKYRQICAASDKLRPLGRTENK